MVSSDRFLNMSGIVCTNSVFRTICLTGNTCVIFPASIIMIVRIKCNIFSRRYVILLQDILNICSLSPDPLPYHMFYSMYGTTYYLTHHLREPYTLLVGYKTPDYYNPILSSGIRQPLFWCRLWCLNDTQWQVVLPTRNSSWSSSHLGSNYVHVVMIPDNRGQERLYSA